MKSLSKVVISLASIVVYSSAATNATNNNDIKYFIGIEDGSFSWTYNGIVRNSDNRAIYSNSIDDNGGFIGLKTGFVYNKKHKLYLSFDSVNTESESELNIFSLNYDYLFYSLKYPKFKSFIGTSYSILKYKEQLNKDIFDNNEATLNAIESWI